ncbi:MAG: glycosyltransferase family 9 protein [bacterium]
MDIRRAIKGVAKKAIGFAFATLSRMIFGRRIPPFETSGVKSILIFSTGALGDFVFFIPTLRAIRKAYENAHIAIVASPINEGLVRPCPYIDEIIVNSDIWYNADARSRRRIYWMRALRWAGRLRSRGFDLAFNLSGYPESIMILYLSGIPYKLGVNILRDRNLPAWRGWEAYKNWDGHTAEAMMDMARALCVEVEEDERAELWVSRESRERAEEYLNSLGISPSDVKVLIAPGCSKKQPARRWDIRKFAAVGDRLAERCGAKVFLVGGRGDLDDAESVAEAMKHKPAVAAGLFGIGEFAALAEMSDLLIGLDTGTTHIAAAVGTPVVALYGGASPRFTGPLGEGHIVVEKPSSCIKPRPCSDLKCPHRRCMEAITVDDVIAAAEEILMRRRGKDGEKEDPLL